MSVAAATARTPHKPRLVFFYSSESGRCRRVEGFLAQVLQRRRTTRPSSSTVSIARSARIWPSNFARVPTLYVVEGKQVRARLEEPRGCRDIQRFLAPWLA